MEFLNVSDSFKVRVLLGYWWFVFAVMQNFYSILRKSSEALHFRIEL